MQACMRAARPPIDTHTHARMYAGARMQERTTATHTHKNERARDAVEELQKLLALSLRSWLRDGCEMAQDGSVALCIHVVSIHACVCLLSSLYRFLLPRNARWRFGAAAPLDSNNSSSDNSTSNACIDRKNDKYTIM